MILHSKPIAYCIGDRDYIGWNHRGRGRGSDVVEEPKEKEEKEFFSEEEFKI